MNDTDYMSIALKLAEKGCGKVSPNPMVGAVIVKEGRIIGQGSHLCFGGPHAERNALASLTESPRGATLYVTLEPCCHHGKTPPCTDAIVESGIRRVVIGTRDPNPMVSGKGTGVLITNRGYPGRRVQGAQSRILPLHKDRASPGCHEICHDAGRQDSHPGRAFPMDYRGALAPKGP